MSVKQYLCIDLKSFYASVECVERGLDPMRAHLVVADPQRSKNTICLAVTPALKKLGVSNRCRLFEIPSHLSYITAPPRMQFYIDYAAEIYSIYLEYIDPADIHVYSIDEVFMEVTKYLKLYHLSAPELARFLMKEIFTRLGIPSACGIGTNLYLAKIALDITAKHTEDFLGILDEDSYRRLLWNHTPLTDFWRIGRNTAARLASFGIYTMKDIARAEESLLYHLFGIDAELLIDHAWGREPVSISDIKAYRSSSKSLGSGQVLMRDYSYEEGKLIVKEMMDLLCLELTAKDLVAKSLTLHVGYAKQFHHPSSHKTLSLPQPDSLDSVLLPAIVELYQQTVSPSIPIRRVSITCNHITSSEYCQQNLFFTQDTLEKNKKMQKAVLSIKNKYGNSAIMKGMNLCPEGTTRERNHQIGGHKSGC